MDRWSKNILQQCSEAHANARTGGQVDVVVVEVVRALGVVPVIIFGATWSATDMHRNKISQTHGTKHAHSSRRAAHNSEPYWLIVPPHSVPDLSTSTHL